MEDQIIYIEDNIDNVNGKFFVDYVVIRNMKLKTMQKVFNTYKDAINFREYLKELITV